MSRIGRDNPTSKLLRIDAEMTVGLPRLPRATAFGLYSVPSSANRTHEQLLRSDILMMRGSLTENSLEQPVTSITFLSTANRTQSPSWAYRNSRETGPLEHRIRHWQHDDQILNLIGKLSTNWYWSVSNRG